MYQHSSTQKAIRDTGQILGMMLMQANSSDDPGITIDYWATHIVDKARESMYREAAAELRYQRDYQRNVRRQDPGPDYDDAIKFLDERSDILERIGFNKNGRETNRTDDTATPVTR